MPKQSTLTPIAVGIVDAVRLMGVSRSRIYELFASGELPSYKDGKRRLIRVADIEARQANLPPAPVPKREPPTGPLLPPEQRWVAIERAAEPERGYADLYNERLTLLVGSMGAEEGRLRAFEYVVRLCQTRENCDLEAAKARVLAAIQGADK
jgi:excisionase family DNA binding protein